MSELKRVYRVENEFGEGPYNAEHTTPARAEYVFGDDDVSDSYVEARPGPQRDGMKYVPGKYKFGFESKAQLANWFGDDHFGPFLANNGYRIATYEVPAERVRYGGHQVAFAGDMAKLVSRRGIKYPETFKRIAASKGI